MHGMFVDPPTMADRGGEGGFVAPDGVGATDAMAPVTGEAMASRSDLLQGTGMRTPA